MIIIMFQNQCKCDPRMCDDQMSLTDPSLPLAEVSLVPPVPPPLPQRQVCSDWLWCYFSNHSSQKMFPSKAICMKFEVSLLIPSSD